LLDRFVAGELVPSADGSEVYEFTPDGRHLRTVDALTGTLRYAFGYDAANRLILITDGDTNITRVEWTYRGNLSVLWDPMGREPASSWTQTAG